MSTAIAREARKKQREPDDRFLAEIRDSVTISGEAQKHETGTAPPTNGSSSRGFFSSYRKDNSATTDPFADSKSASKAREKEKASAKKEAEDKKKKASRHADAIDKLDPSGFWGTGMFHHESAYDAAAPSRNKSHDAAPMRAFNEPGQTPQASSSSAAGGSEARPNLLGHDSFNEVTNVTFEDKEAAGTPTNEVDSSGPGLSKSKSLKKIRSRSHSRDKIAIPAEEDYINARAKEQKNALANAWGVADPEPFEDFAMMAATTAPRGETGLASAASSIWNGYEGARGRNPSGGVVPPVNGVELGAPVNVDAADLQEQMLDQPIAWNKPVMSRKESGNVGPKRTKSLMQRIRNMRDNPNVPLAADDQVTTPTGSAYGRSSSPSNGAFPSPSNASFPGSHQRSYLDNDPSIAPRARSPLPGTSAHGPSSYSGSANNDAHASSDSRPTGHRTSSSQSNKRLPPIPPSAASNLAPPNGSATSLDPFADTPSGTATKPDFEGGIAKTHNNHNGLGNGSLAAPRASSTSRHPGARSPRSPVPPPQPLDLPGGGYFPRVTETDRMEELADPNGASGTGGWGNSGGSKSGGGGGGLGRKPSLMKRLMGKGNS